MPFELANLNISRIALHQVFKRSEDKLIITPRYNNCLTNLSAEGIEELRSRLTDSLGNESSSIDMDIVKVEEDSCFQCLARMIYADDQNFIEISKSITNKLAQCQTSRKIPGGIVVSLNGTVGNNNLNFIAIIKAESQKGFALQSSEEIPLDLVFLKELLLTPHQKLYKIGFFIELRQTNDIVQLRSPDDFKAIVYDQNMNNSETREAALYFYESFLGCSIHHSNKKLTRDFYNYTKEYINALEVTGEKKVDLHSALYTYLKVDVNPMINTSSFAQQYFEPEMIDDYLNHMANKEFPANSIQKDVEYIKTKLRRRKIKFSSKVQISAPVENFENLVKVIEQTEEKTILSIAGTIEEQ